MARRRLLLYPLPGIQKGDELKGANNFGAVWYHKLRTPQSEDRLVFDDKKHPDRFFNASTTDDQRFLCVFGSESTSGNTLSFKDLTKENAPFVSISDNFENDFTVIDNLGDQLIVKTNYKAPNQRLLLIRADKPEEGDWETLIPENFDDVLENAVVCGDKIVCSYLHNASGALRVFGMDGKFIKEIALPEIGTIVDVSGEKGENQAFFSFTSFLRPTTSYALDMQTLEAKLFKAPQTGF